MPVTSLTCDISDYYHGMPEERVAAIDKFVNAVVAGEQPHITMDDIRFMGGGKSPKESDSGPQGVEHGIHNFGIRPNLNLYGKNFAFTKKQETEASSEIATSIPYSEVENLKDGDFFEYKGRQYQFHIGDEFYANPVKHKKKTEYVDEKTKIIIERIVKIGKQDLMEMVKQCLKRIL